MARKVFTGGLKGLFKVPEEKLSGGLDLPYNISSVRGAGNETVDFGAVGLKVISFIEVASIYRLKVDENKFLDVLWTYPGSYIPLGIGKPDKKRQGELEYESDLRELSLEDITLQEGVEEALFEDIATLVEEGEIDNLPCSDSEKETLKQSVKIGSSPHADSDKEIVFDIVRKVLRSLRKSEMRVFFPLTAGRIKRKTEEGIVYDVDRVVPTVKLTEDLLKKKAQKLTLNGIFVGVNQNDDIVIAFCPERVSLLSSIVAAKSLNSSSVNFKALNYVSQLRLKSLENPIRREKVARKLRGYVSSMEEQGEMRGIQIIEDLADALEQQEFNASLVENLLKQAHEEKFNVIRDFLLSEGIIDKSRLLVRNRNGKFFLRTGMAHYGIPLYDYSKFDSVVFAPIPRPIKVNGEWQVQASLKPIGGLVKEDDGSLSVFQFNSDAYAMAFDYPVYRVLKALMFDFDKYNWGQIRALLSEGFDNFKGLSRLEKDFGRFKIASAVYGDLIKHIKGLLSNIIYKEDSEIADVENAKREIAATLANDGFISSYVNAMEEFLYGRSIGKIYRISDLVSDPGKFVDVLFEKGILYEKDGKIYANWRNFEKEKESIERFVKEGVDAKLAVLRAKTTISGLSIVRGIEPTEEALRDAKILAEQIVGAVQFTVPSLERKDYVSPLVEKWKEQQLAKKEIEPVKVEEQTEKKEVKELVEELESVEVKIESSVEEEIADIEEFESMELEDKFKDYLEITA